MEKPRGSEGKVDMTALKALVDGASGTVVIDERDTGEHCERPASIGGADGTR